MNFTQPLSPSHTSSVSNPFVHTITYSTPRAQHLQILSRYSINHSRTFISLTLFYLYALWSICLPFLLLYWRGQRLFVDLQRLRGISGSRYAWVSTALPRSPAGWNLEINRKITRHFLSSCAARAHSVPATFQPLLRGPSPVPKSIIVLSSELTLHDVRAIVHISGRRTRYQSIGSLEWLGVVRWVESS
jgi:hypothetical protein